MRMLPKRVTRNVTNAQVEAIVFRNEIIPKNSINDADEKKPTENSYHQPAWQILEGVSNLRVEIIHKLMVQDRT